MNSKRKTEETENNCNHLCLLTLHLFVLLERHAFAIQRFGRMNRIVKLIFLPTFKRVLRYDMKHQSIITIIDKHQAFIAVMFQKTGQQVHTIFH